MSKLKTQIKLTMMLGVFSLDAGRAGHLALADISHGEADASLEWSVVRLCALVFLTPLSFRSFLRSGGRLKPYAMGLISGPTDGIPTGTAGSGKINSSRARYFTQIPMTIPSAARTGVSFFDFLMGVTTTGRRHRAFDPKRGRE